MYLRAKYTKYKMAKTKFSIWRYIICEICKKNGSNRPFLASRVADTIFPPPIEGHHRQLDNQCKDPMDKTKDCRVGQLTNNVPSWYHSRTSFLITIKYSLHVFDPVQWNQMISNSLQYPIAFETIFVYFSVQSASSIQRKTDLMLRNMLNHINNQL